MRKNTNRLPEFVMDGPNKNEKYMWLNNAELQISPDIQRRLDPARVAEIVENYSSKIANPIKVSYREGKYRIFDGMHTRTAQCMINGTDDFPIFCRVYYGLTKEEEARLFAAQFGSSEPVPMGYRLRALEVAKDPEVLNFLKVTKDCKFAITLGTPIARNGYIAAVCAAFKAYRALSAPEYIRMLKILHRTWAGESWSVSRNMIGGMTRLMKMYEIKANPFVKVFREVKQEDILREVMRFTGMPKDGAYAAALAKIYDQKAASALREVG